MYSLDDLAAFAFFLAPFAPRIRITWHGHIHSFPNTTPVHGAPMSFTGEYLTAMKQRIDQEHVEAAARKELASYRR